MKVQTTRFGEIEINEEAIIDFPRGIAGFPGLRRFFLIAHKDPVKWLQSAEDPDVAFIVAEPAGLVPDYVFHIHDDSANFLNLTAEEEVLALVILSVKDKLLTANLRSPIVINISTGTAAQMYIDDDKAPVSFCLNATTGAGTGEEEEWTAIRS